MKQSTSEESNKTTCKVISFVPRLIQSYVKKFFIIEKKKKVELLRVYLNSIPALHIKEVLKEIKKKKNAD